MVPFLFVITMPSDVVTCRNVGFCGQKRVNRLKLILRNLTDFVRFEYVITRNEV